jgi:hypothetical protein
VFLPRPLLFVDRIPRNFTGKLPRSVLKSLARARAVARGRPGLSRTCSNFLPAAGERHEAPQSWRLL